MSSRVDGVNRTVLALLGLLLLVAGALGLALSFGAFGNAGRPVLPQPARDFARGEPRFWWAAAGGCLALALLALCWLMAQLRTERVGRLDLTRDDRDGLTTVRAGALADAVEAEARELRGVAGASAHVLDRSGHRLVLTVDLTDYADIVDIRSALEDRVVAHTRQALNSPDLPVEIELRPGRAPAGGRPLL